MDDQPDMIKPEDLENDDASKASSEEALTTTDGIEVQSQAKTENEEKSPVSQAKDIFVKVITKVLAVFIFILSLRWLDRFIPQAWLDALPENRVKISLPIFILFVGFFLFVMLSAGAPKVTKKSHVKSLTTVRVVKVQKEDVRVPVYSQGIVQPSKEMKLVSLVSGPVTFVSENFVDGGFVEKDEILLKISPRSYLQDKAKATAQLAQAKAAQVAKQGELRVRGTLRSANGKAQIRQVNASVAAAEADLQRVNDYIAKTEVTAAFSGIVRNAAVSEGQILSSGMPMAQLFSPEKSEIKLSLSDKQISLIDLPSFFNRGSAAKTEAQEKKLSKVKFLADFGSKEYYWQGHVVRSAGGRNELNRLQYVIAEIEAPFGKDSTQSERPPLTPGSFVRAEIEGRLFAGISVLPREALRTNQRVWLVNAENKLESRAVNLVYRGKEKIYIDESVKEGERVIISDLKVFMEGLEVNAEVEDRLHFSDDEKEKLTSMEIDKKPLEEMKTPMAEPLAKPNAKADALSSKESK